MNVQMFEVDNGDCPYLPHRRWITHSFQTDTLPEGLYEEMLAAGWRRSGCNFYQNHCPGCSCCTPARVPVERFQPSRSQRRVLRRNEDVVVSVAPLIMDEELFTLYSRYVAARHQTGGSGDLNEPAGESPEQFERFLLKTPISSRCMLYRVSDRLVGAGWVDLLPDGVSSVYFAFDPDESRRSLGIFSMVEEMRLARALGKQWLYLGFYVPGSPKMVYKGAFRPREFAIHGEWTEREDDIPC